MDNLREPRPPNENASPCYQQGEASETVHQSTSTNSAEYSPHRTPRQDQAEAFLEDLLGDIDSPNRFVLVAYGEGSTLGVWHAPASALSPPMAEVGAWNVAEGNVYWGAALMDPDLTSGARGGKADIRQMLAVVVDIDDAEAAKHVDAALESGRWPLGLVPSRIVQTSSQPTPRYQLVWLLKEPSDDLPLWERVARGLREAWGGDACTVDAAHVWRLPGFTNWPNEKKRAAGRVPEPAELLPQQGAKWDLGEIADALPEDTAADTATPEPLRVDVHTRFADADSVEDIARFLPKWLREDLQDTTPAEDRSKLDFRIASEMAANGYLPGDLIRLYELGLRDGRGFADKVRERSEQVGDEAAERYLLSTWDRAHSERKGRGEPMISRHPLDRKAETPPPQALRALTFDELQALQIPPRRLLLAPWLPEKGLAMVFAPRGVGKTWFALSVAWAVATGGEFLRFKAEAPRRVLYIDGEMPGALLQERMREIAGGMGGILPTPSHFRILGADLQETGMPDLSTVEGQQAFEPFLRDTDLIVVDNLSCLAPSVKENEAEGWAPLQGWALLQRRLGRSVLFVHHAGKGGTQRGTSKREDVLDTVISLQHPSDYTPDQGARFEVSFTKSRGMTGEDAAPFEAVCETRDRRAMWLTRSLEDVTLKRVVQAKKDGLSVREIAEELDISKSRVQRLVDKGRASGLLLAGE